MKYNIKRHGIYAFISYDGINWFISPMATSDMDNNMQYPKYVQACTPEQMKLGVWGEELVKKQNPPMEKIIQMERILSSLKYSKDIFHYSPITK